MSATPPTCPARIAAWRALTAVARTDAAYALPRVIRYDARLIPCPAPGGCGAPAGTPCRAKVAPWTDAHRREALRRTYEIAVAVVDNAAPFSCDYDWRPVALAALESEAEWRRALAYVGCGTMLTSTRVDREVRRVRDIAEGRLMREMVWHVRGVGIGHEAVFAKRDEARAMRDAYTSGVHGAPEIVRVTRYRRTA